MPTRTNFLVVSTRLLAEFGPDDLSGWVGVLRFAGTVSDPKKKEEEEEEEEEGKKEAEEEQKLRTETHSDTRR